MARSPSAHPDEQRSSCDSGNQVRGRPGRRERSAEGVIRSRVVDEQTSTREAGQERKPGNAEPPPFSSPRHHPRSASPRHPRRQRHARHRDSRGSHDPAREIAGDDIAKGRGVSPRGSANRKAYHSHHHRDPPPSHKRRHHRSRSTSSHHPRNHKRRRSPVPIEQPSSRRPQPATDTDPAARGRSPRVAQTDDSVAAKRSAAATDRSRRPRSQSIDSHHSASVERAERSRSSEQHKQSGRDNRIRRRQRHSPRRDAGYHHSRSPPPGSSRHSKRGVEYENTKSRTARTDERVRDSRLGTLPPPNQQSNSRRRHSRSPRVHPPRLESPGSLRREHDQIERP